MANTIIALYKDIHRNSVILHSRETHIQMPTLIQHSTETHIHIPTTFCTLQKQTFNCPLLSCTLLKPIFTNKQTSYPLEKHKLTCALPSLHSTETHIYIPTRIIYYRNTYSNAHCHTSCTETHIQMPNVVWILKEHTFICTL